MQAAIRNANDLAAQFAERAQARDGSLWLSAKQVAWLRSLAVRTPNVEVYKQHGWPVIEGHDWMVTIHHNGAGLFRIGKWVGAKQIG